MREARLGDVVASMKNGLYKPATEYADDGIPCLRMYNIDAGTIVWRDIKRMRVSEREFAEYGLAEGDLLVNRVNSRELVGKSAYVPASLEPSVFESKNIRVRLDRSRALPKFINYQLFARGSRHFANNAQQVVGMASISQGQLADFPIVLASLDEQRRIVAEIEKQFSRLDEAVATLQRVRVNLRRQRLAISVEATSGTQGARERGALPPGWHWAELGELANVVRGGSPRPAGDPRYFGGPIPWITVGPITADDEDYLRNVPTGLTEAGRERSRYIEPHTLLLTNSGATLGVPKISLIGGCINDGVAALLDVDYPLKKYLLFFLRTKTAEMRGLNQGAAQPNLNTSIIKRYRVPVPPAADQLRIVAEVDRRLSIVREVEAQVDANLKRAEALRQAVLQRAFSGELVSQPLPTEARPKLQLIPGTTTATESARVALSAEIVHRLHANPTFGQVKHQKLFHLCEHIARLDLLKVQYRRAGYGPLNLPMIESNERVMEQSGWYAERPRPGSAGHQYVHMSKAGGHAPYLACFSDEQMRTIRRLIDLMRDWKTDRCEMFSTVYAAWNDLLIMGREATPDAVVREVLELWDDKKKRFTRQQWLDQVTWITEHGFAPTGFGQLTRGATDGVTPDLFRDSAH